MKTINGRNGKPAPHGRRYPWGDWFRRKRFVLIRGRDYDSQPHGMVQTIRQAGYRPEFDLDLRITVNGDRITVEVLGLHNPALPRRKGPRRAAHT